MPEDTDGAEVLRALCYGRGNAQNPAVQHGFTDDTHNACCLLGSRSRAGADATGNPIGKLAEEVAGATRAPGAMTPWTTCMGSAVCSSYGQKYGDAYLKFAVSPDKTLMYLPGHGTVLTPECEHFLQEEVFKGQRHGTPGVEMSNKTCSPEEQNAIRRDVIPNPFQK